jgi:Uma2 family endonuclease
MIAEPPPPVRHADLPEPERPILLRGISWKTYESLLDDYAERGAPRLTYDHGVLEIVSPLKLHEQTHVILAEIVSALTYAWDLDSLNLASTTFKREDLERGFEPDSCFYLRSAARVSSLTQINLSAGDPPPDLVIEVDVTSPSLDKMPIFAAIGVPEVWRWSAGEVRFFVLTEGAYQERHTSEVLAPLTVERVNDWLTQRTAMRVRQWTQDIHRWAEINPPL